MLTGFDAPILQAMYFDKPLRDHTLLQAICRVNRTYSEQKTQGLIVGYLGIFDDVAAAMEFDDQSVEQVVRGIHLRMVAAMGTAYRLNIVCGLHDGTRSLVEARNRIVWAPGGVHPPALISEEEIPF